METHKTVASFISASMPTLHGPARPRPGLAGIWLGISQELTGIGSRGFATDGGEKARGPAG